MLPHKPGDWPRLFVQYLNSGDLEELASLYAPSQIRGPIRGNDRRPRRDSRHANANDPIEDEIAKPGHQGQLAR